MNCHSSVTETSSCIGMTDNSALDFAKLKVYNNSEEDIWQKIFY